MKFLKFYASILVVALSFSAFSSHLIRKDIKYESIVIKLKDSPSVAANDNSYKNSIDIAVSYLNSAAEDTFTDNANHINPPFAFPSPARDPVLSRYLSIPLNEYTSTDEIAKAIDDLEELGISETVYAFPKPEPAQVVENATPSFTALQGYKEAAPLGIDAIYANSFPGGKGQNVNIIDIEGGWNTSHEDLPSMAWSIGEQYTITHYIDHGTAVLGVIGAKENGYGITGIAPEARIGYSGIKNSNPANAIKQAADAVGSGGIIVIELHNHGDVNTANCTCNFSQCNFVPMEYFQAEFDAILYATNKGVTVVEAAGNGSVNLDDERYNNAFNLANRDSGAIMVAANKGSGSLSPACFTNYGSRIDAHGWGRNVTTLGYGDLYTGSSDNTWYTNTFSGTSSATPIVVGAVASMQGISKSLLKRTLSPSQLRYLVRQYNTPQAPSTKRIAGLPNLRQAIDFLNQEEDEMDTSWLVPAVYYPLIIN